MFDFEVHHIARTKNVVIDTLSRHPPTEDDIQERDNE